MAGRKKGVGNRGSAGRTPGVVPATQISATMDLHSVTKELEAIKRLHLLLLAKLGASSEEIAAALGVDGSTIRKMISFRSVKRISAGDSGE